MEKSYNELYNDARRIAEEKERSGGHPEEILDNPRDSQYITSIKEDVLRDHFGFGRKDDRL